MHRTGQRVMNLAFGDDDDDSEFLIFVIRRPRWIWERAEDLDDLDDIDFVTRYRLSKPTVLSILENIEDALEFETARLVKVLLELRRYLCKKYTGTSSKNFFKKSTKQAIRNRY